MSDLSPLEKLLLLELSDIKNSLKALREGKEEPLPRMLPASFYNHLTSPRADAKPPAPVGDEKFAAMASIYSKKGDAK